MGTKTILLVFLLLAICTLHVVSEVAEVSTSEKKSANGLNDANYGPGGGGFGPGGGGFGPGGGGFGPGGGGNYCRWGCCRRDARGCKRCCGYAGEVAETHN